MFHSKSNIRIRHNKARGYFKTDSLNKYQRSERWLLPKMCGKLKRVRRTIRMRMVFNASKGFILIQYHTRAIAAVGVSFTVLNRVMIMVVPLVMQGSWMAGSQALTKERQAISFRQSNLCKALHVTVPRTFSRIAKARLNNMVLTTSSILKQLSPHLIPYLGRWEYKISSFVNAWGPKRRGNPIWQGLSKPKILRWKNITLSVITKVLTPNSRASWTLGLLVRGTNEPLVPRLIL
jgi:hypothetical protein